MASLRVGGHPVDEQDDGALPCIRTAAIVTDRGSLWRAAARE